MWGFEDGLRQTIAWYRDNPDWWHHVKSGDYRHYYERLYGARLRAASEPTGGA